MAQPNNTVKVVEVCRVAPQPSSPPDSSTPPSPPHSLPLTFFDLPWLRFAPIQRIFFYEVSSLDTSLFFGSILPKLKTSLSITLQHFLPLTGNLTWPKDSPKPILNYVKGDTVSLTIAESDADFCHLVSCNNISIEAKEYHPLIPYLSVSHEQAAALALQITIFPNRGFAIGSAMHHAIVDGKTSTMFFKSWAHICKHECNTLPDQLKPFYDRRVIEDPTGLEAIFVKDWLNIGGPNNRSLMFSEVIGPLDWNIRGTFQFTQAQIQTLKQSVMTTLAEKKQQHSSPLHLTTFSLVCAYTCVCLVKAEEIPAHTNKILLALAVDCRSRLEPPIPANYLGNCIALNGAFMEKNALLGEDGLFVALEAIAETIKGLEKTLFDGAETWVSRMCSTVMDTSVKLVSTAGSHRFELYGTDFGWGRPKKTDSVSIDRTGAISFSDSKNGGGAVEVGLVLKKHEMEAFASLFAKGLEHL